MDPVPDPLLLRKSGSAGSNKALTHIFTDSISTDLDTIFCDRLSNFRIWYLLNKCVLTLFNGKG